MPAQILWVRLCPKLGLVLTPQLSHGGGWLEGRCLIHLLGAAQPAWAWRQLWQGSSQKVTNQLLSSSECPQVLGLLELRC